MIDNPLRQYFRRPGLYLKIPSTGRYYPAGALDLPENKELPVFPMTAIDEITSKTPDALFNGSAVVDIIKSCVPNIRDPWGLPMMDLDPILLGIRAATSGNTMDVDSTCPACNETSTYELNLISILGKLTPGNYDEPVQLGDLKFKFKPLSYRTVNSVNTTQFEIEVALKNLDAVTDENVKITQSKAAMVKLRDLSMTILSAAIEYIETPESKVESSEHIQDFLRNCDATRYKLIRETITKLRETTELKPSPVKCPECQHEFEQRVVINVSDFFG